MKQDNSKQSVLRRNYRINELSQAFRVGRSKIYMEIKAGRLRSFKMGKVTLVSIEAAEAWQAGFEVTT